MSRATEQFKERVRAAFDEIGVGQVFTFRRTFTDGDVALFCGVTGDFNPYHIDELFAAENWYGRRIIPGLLTASMLTHIGGMLGILATEMTFEYLAPVYIGDTITCTVTFVEKDAVKRTFTGAVSYTNQEGREVQRARFCGFPAAVRLAR